MSRQVKLAATAAVATAGLAACGGSSSAGSSAVAPATNAPASTTASTSEAAPYGAYPASAASSSLPPFNNHGTKTVTGRTITVEADNFYFEPSAIVGKPGEKITVKLENSSSTEHNFTIENQRVDVDLDGHATKTATITIPASGYVSFYCEYHRGMGMAGVVKPT